MKFVATQDIGDLGPKESAPVTYTWSFVENLSGFAVWVFLLLAFILIKENRNGRALAILIPLVAVNLFWIAIKKLTGMPSLSIAIFDVLFNSFTVGLAIVWLISHRFAGSNRFAVLVLSLIIMMLTFAVAIVGFKGIDFDEEVLQMSILFGASAVAVMLSLVMAGLNCSRRYGAVKFMLWLGLWCVVLGSVAMVAFFIAAVIFAAAQGGHIDIASQLLQVAVMGLVLGGILYVLVLPYMILVLNNDMFRQRFYGCFRLREMLPDKPAVEAEAVSSDDREETDFRYS